jgi:hypothetical protein
MAGSDQLSERVNSPLGVDFGHADARAANFHSCVKVVLRQGMAKYRFFFGFLVHVTIVWLQAKQ